MNDTAPSPAPPPDADSKEAISELLYALEFRLQYMVLAEENALVTEQLNDPSFPQEQRGKVPESMRGTLLASKDILMICSRYTEAARVMQEADVPRRSETSPEVQAIKRTFKNARDAFLAEIRKYPTYKELPIVAEAIKAIAEEKDISGFATKKFNPQNPAHIAYAHAVEHEGIYNLGKPENAEELVQSYYQAIALHYLADVMLKRGYNRY